MKKSSCKNSIRSRKTGFEVLEERNLLSLDYGYSQDSIVELPNDNEKSAYYESNNVLRDLPLIDLDLPYKQNYIQKENFADYPETLATIYDSLTFEEQLEETCLGETRKAQYDDVDKEGDTWNDVYDSHFNLNEKDNSRTGAGENRSGGGDSGGANMLAPFVSGGASFNYVSYVFSADAANTYNKHAFWFQNPAPNTTLTYTVQGLDALSQSDNSFFSFSLDSRTGEFTITPNGNAGECWLTLSASNGFGVASIGMYICCNRVIGYSVEEQTYGADNWESVEDKGADWQLLWRENEYRWTPVLEVGSLQVLQMVNTVQFSSRLLGGSDPYHSFGSQTSPNVQPDSGGGDGGNEHGTNGQDLIDRTRVIGIPNSLGENSIDVSVSLLGNWVLPNANCLDFNNAVLNLSVSSSVPFEEQGGLCPRIGVMAIESVNWTACDEHNSIKLGNDPNIPGGKRCFPESPSVNSVAYKTLNISVTLRNPIPSGMIGTIKVGYFDPRNYWGTNSEITVNDVNSVRDNNGNAGIVFDTVSCSGGTQQREFSALFRFGQANAGDNYIAVAHPNPILSSIYTIQDSLDVNGHSTYSSQIFYTSGRQDDDGNDILVSLPNSLRSPVLTVWRTLWMERDYMKHPNDGNVNGSGMPYIGGLVLSEMRRASIEIQEYVDNYHKEINAHHITLNESHNELLNHYSDFVDIPVSTENYWTVRMVGVYAINNHQGETSFVGLMHDNTIYVAGASISNGIVDWNQNNVNQPMNFFYVYQVVTLHELGHAFGLRHVFQPGELMYPSLMYNNLGSSFTVNDLQFIQSRAILVNNSLSCEL